MRLERLLLAVWIAWVLPTIAGARPEPKSEGPIKPPPRSAFEAVWPTAAKAEGLGGRAAAVCKVDAAGAPTECRVAHEYPSARGFGAALLQLAPSYRLSATAISEAKADGGVVIEGDWYEFDKAPDWLKKPTADDLISVWPTEALHKGISGHATLSCVVSTQGALFDCFVEDESPKGTQFAQAALALTPQFLMKPARRGGAPVLSVVRIPINFKTSGSGGDLPGSQKAASAAMLWPVAPSFADVIAAYPPKARAARIGGRATLYCRFRRDGRLVNCDTIAEQPRGQGFGSAAHKLAEQFRAFEKTPDGKGLSGVAVQLPITFDPAMLDPISPVIGKPEWSGLPESEDVVAAFGGIGKGVGTMRVTLSCTVDQGGGVRDCQVTSETPAGQGAGKAALVLSSKFRVNTWTSEGLPVIGGIVRIPIRYEPEEPKPATTP